MKSKALKSIVLTTFLTATMLIFLSAVQVPIKAEPDGVEINEFMANPTGTDIGKEWVEIINTGTTSVDVSGWRLGNKTYANVATIPPSTTLNPGDVYLFSALPGQPLANSGTPQILLRDSGGTLVDNKTYTSSEAYTAQSSGQIYDGKYDLWESHRCPSPGYKNNVNPGSIKVNEAYPNTTVADKSFVEIYNTGPSAVDLTGWKLRCRFLYPVALSGSIPAGGHWVYVYNVNLTFYLGLGYSNVAIHDQNNQTVDRMQWNYYYYRDDGTKTGYYPYQWPSSITAGHSLERYPAGKDTDRDNVDFRDQSPPTPCSLFIDAAPPVADAGPDQTVFPSLVTFDGSGSSDDLAIVSYVWTFTDGGLQTLTGVNPSYTFNNVGTFNVMLNVTDPAGNWDTDNVTITVKPLPGVGGEITPIDKFLMIMPWIGLASAIAIAAATTAITIKKRRP